MIRLLPWLGEAFFGTSSASLDETEDVLFISSMKLFHKKWLLSRP